MCGIQHFTVCFVFVLLQTRVFCLTKTNNANISWYEHGDLEPKHFFAGEPLPRGLQSAYKIVVNQEFPVLWEVKFSYFDNLEFLVLDSIGVLEIQPGTFKDLKPLTNLSISNNKVREIRKGVFNNVFVKNLDLSHNQIEMIEDEAFNNMPVLQVLLLDFNKIRSWHPNWFLNTPKLTTFSFSYNQIEILPEYSFASTTEVVNIDFGHNKIKSIDSKAFAGLHEIGNLVLSNNQIKEFNENIFDDVNSVSMIDFTENPLVCPSEKFVKNLIENKNAKLFYDCTKNRK